MTEETGIATEGQEFSRTAVLNNILHSFSVWLTTKSAWRFPLVAFLSGFLMSRGFSPINFFPAVFVAVPVMIFLLDHVRNAQQAFSTGWWTGFGFLSTSLSWIAFSFTQQENVPAFLAPFAILALAGLMALYIGVAFWLSWRLWRPGFSRVFLFAAVWTLFEFARGFLFTGFPWHLMGTIWADWLPVAQLANILSIYGLSFLTVMAAGFLAIFFGGRNSVGAFCISFVPIAAVIVGAFWGQARLDAHATEYELGVGLKLVQANVPQREKWIPRLIDDHFDKHMQLSRRGSERGRAEGVKLLIWPEAAVQRENFDREGSLLRWRMSRLLDFGAYAITGAPRYERSVDGVTYYNSLVAFNSRGQLYARYDKEHLVPFGEYMPFRGLFDAVGLSSLVGSSFSAGEGRQLIRLPGVPPFSPMICYEIIFPGSVPAGDERPSWLLNITNDGWFGLTDGPYQHLGLARFRAIEEGLPVVRAASTGVSAVIDAFGRTIADLKVNQEGVLESPLPAAAAPPAYATVSKMMAVLALAIFMVSIFMVLAVVQSSATRKNQA